MPTYTFIDKDSGNEETHFLKMSELDDFKEKNPNLKQKLTTGSIIGGVSTSSGSLPEGFKDKLREMKKKHPAATGINHLI